MDLQLLLDNFSSELKNRSEHLTEDSVRYYLFACMLRQDPQLNNYMLELPYDDMLKSSDMSKTLPVYVDSKSLSEDGNKSVSKMELDMCYYNGSQCFSIEIKFHRHNTSEHSFPHTMSAGALFNDIRRLGLIHPNPLVKEYTRLFLYVTDQQMHDYLQSNKNNLAEDGDEKGDFTTYRMKLKEFYSLEPGKEGRFEFAFDEKDANVKTARGKTTPMTFIETANKSGNKQPCHDTVDVEVRKLYDSDFLCKSSSVKDSACHVRLYSVIDESNR